MSYHFCCFKTLNQDSCPIDFSRSGQEVLSVVWKMCNTAFQWYLMPLSQAVASIITVTSHLVKCSLTQSVAETHLLIGPCLRSADTCHGSKSKATCSLISCKPGRGPAWVLATSLFMGMPPCLATHFPLHGMQDGSGRSRKFTYKFYQWYHRCMVIESRANVTNRNSEIIAKESTYYTFLFLEFSLHLPRDFMIEKKMIWQDVPGHRKKRFVQLQLALMFCVLKSW